MPGSTPVAAPAAVAEGRSRGRSQAGRRRPESAARAFLSREARAVRGSARLPVLLGLAGVACGVAQAWLIARLLATLIGHGAPGAGAGWPDLAGAAALALLQTGLSVAAERVQLSVGTAVRAGLRARVFARLLADGPADTRPVGERASLAVDRIEALDGYFSRYRPAAAVALFGPLLVALAAGAADWVSGAALAVCGVLVPVALALTGIGAAQASARQFAALQRLSGRFLDRMRGLPTLVLFNRQDAEAEALGAAATELRERTMRVLRVAFLSGTAQELLAALALVCLAIHHRTEFNNGAADATPALFTLLLVPAFFAPLRAFSAAYHERLSANGAAEALAPLLDAPDAGGGLRLEEVPPRAVLTFADVRLSYDPARPPALDGVSFRVLPGETLVLTGESGAGKTSVLRLLLGFRRPDAGRIAVNGIDVAGLAPAELRRLSSYVGQRAHLFRATIADNIRLARPEATDAEVEAAARAARVLDFAEALPQGLGTVVGEGGFGLSGGQAQRVAVARAFLRDTPLVLLDEPTAHLDPGTEAEVIESLRRLCLGRTAVVATHSRAVRVALGRTLELSGGRVVADERAARG